MLWNANVLGKGFVLAMLTLLLTGCGGGGSSSSNVQGDQGSGDQGSNVGSVVTGVVADGYIRNAVVFLDLDDDGEQDADEPSTRTRSGGAYTLRISSAAITADNYNIVAVIGSDAVDEDMEGAGFESTYSLTTIKGQRVITPISNLVAQVGGKDMTKTKADELVRNLLGVDMSVADDYVALSRTSAEVGKKELAARVHRQAQVIARLQARLEKAYQAVAVQRKALQAVIANEIANKMGSVKEAAEAVTTVTGSADSAAAGIAMEVTTDTAALQRRASDLGKKRAVGLANPLEYFGVMSWRGNSGSSQDDGGYAEVQFGRAPVISSSRFSFMIEKGGTTHALTASAGTTNMWTYWGPAAFLAAGNWRLIVSDGRSTAVLATKELKDGSTFSSAVAPEKSGLSIDFVTDTSGRVVSAHWNRKSFPAGVNVYTRLTMRRKTHQGERMRGKISPGTIVAIPSQALRYKASDLQYRFELWDGPEFSKSSNAQVLTDGDGWKDIPTAASSSPSAYAWWYRIYNDNYNNEKRRTVFQVGVFYADAVKKVVIKRGSAVLDSYTILSMDFRAKTCTTTPTQTSFCEFAEPSWSGFVEGGRQVDFWVRADRSLPDGDYTIELHDQNGAVVSKVGKRLTSTGLLEVVSTSSYRAGSDGRGFVAFSWSRLRTDKPVYYRAEFATLYGEVYDRWLGNSERRPINNYRIHPALFYNKVKTGFCDSPDTKEVDHDYNPQTPKQQERKRLMVRVSAFDSPYNEAINSRSRSRWLELSYACSRTSIPTIKR